MCHACVPLRSSEEPECCSEPVRAKCAPTVGLAEQHQQ